MPETGRTTRYRDAESPFPSEVMDWIVQSSVGRLSGQSSIKAGLHLEPGGEQ
jgi:hypothetical protein